MRVMTRNRVHHNKQRSLYRLALVIEPRGGKGHIISLGVYFEYDNITITTMGLQLYRVCRENDMYGMRDDLGQEIQ